MRCLQGPHYTTGVCCQAVKPCRPKHSPVALHHLSWMVWGCRAPSPCRCGPFTPWGCGFMAISVCMCVSLSVCVHACVCAVYCTAHVHTGFGCAQSCTCLLWHANSKRRHSTPYIILLSMCLEAGNCHPTPIYILHKDTRLTDLLCSKVTCYKHNDH